MFAACDADTDADAITDADAAFVRGAACVQELSQSGLQPANLRLIYGPEVARFVPGSRLELAGQAVLLLGFESADDSQG
jgi:hypothetical protein